MLQEISKNLLQILRPIILTRNLFCARILRIMGNERSGTEGAAASHLVHDILNRAYMVETVEQRLDLLRSDLSP